jgi:hypothetical protein
VTINLTRLKEIRECIDSVWRIVDDPLDPRDSIRKSYMFSELNTLMSIISMVECKSYKECFILLRSVFEKYLYFWLMFDGRKYKWTTHYFVYRTTSITDREARDKTLNMMNNLKMSGDPKYKNWELQAGRKDNVIIVTTENEGLFEAGDHNRTGEIIPIYNEMLIDYDPAIKFLSDIENMVNSITDMDDVEKLTFKQDHLYNRFIYIKNIYRNLTLNNLINKFQLYIIRIHYNFLSQYVHPSKYSFELWDRMHGYREYSSNLSMDQIFKELILLYVIKLIQLYFATYINGYKNTTNHVEYNKFELLVNELREMSKDFWFYDNQPLQFDIDYSNEIKSSWILSGRSVPDDLIYNDSPLERLVILRSRYPSNSGPL